MITIYETEDDQIVLNKNNSWIKTLYASCPEQATCFYQVFKDKQYETLKEWEQTLYDFQTGWEIVEEQD